MRKCVIFDLDGTLLDTAEDITAAANRALIRLGMRERTVAEIRSFLGDGILALMTRAMCSEGDVTHGVELFREYYAGNTANLTRPYAGVEDLLDILTARGVSAAIVSNKPQYAVTELANTFFPRMTVAVGDADGLRIKPAPDTCFAAMERLGVRADDCVYVGDSDVDIETARNAGIPCVSVCWGFRSEEFLREHGADRIAHDADELLCLLEAEGIPRESNEAGNAVRGSCPNPTGNTVERRR